MGFFSSIFKPVTSVIGGLLGNSSQDKANAANQAFANEQFQFQKDYIHNQLQWKVEDAKKAGLHPMAALGIQSPGFSPVSSNQQPLDYSWIGDLGQSANYASTKAKTLPQQKQMLALQLRGLELDNEYKEAQIDQLKVDTLASTIASDQALGSPSSPKVNAVSPVPELESPGYVVTPSEVKSASSRGTQAGGPPSVRWFTNPDGSVTRSMSEQAKETNEDDVINTVGWHIDNNLVPLAGRLGYNSGVNPAVYAPPLSMLPKGAKGWLPDGYNKFVPVYRWNVRGAYYGDDY